MGIRRNPVNLRLRLLGLALMPLPLSMLMGLKGGVPTGTPSQRLYGLATVRFGELPNRLSCSGVLFKQWVITDAHCENAGKLVVEMLGLPPQEIPRTDDNVKYVGDRINGFILVRLVKPFKSRGEPVISRVRLPSQPPELLAGKSLHCFGRGHDVEAPDGDPGKSSGNHKYRSAEFNVQSAEATKLLVGLGQFGEKILEGDSGGPCFAANQAPGSDEEFTVHGLVNNGVWDSDPNAHSFTYRGAHIYTLYSYRNEIEAIARVTPSQVRERLPRP